ncbi:unannotated protein [freshwater metagenome]|uniref:Unannotated protein n=1 Tax=freshwater metagenome TaxID=449393 RepID=A0A6J6E4G8_9ZZZZ|nr:DUF288 domain-containing protein [Actinomycetota bacterium]
MLISATEAARAKDISVVVIGDGKSPAEFSLPGADYFSVEDQRRLPFASAEALPLGTYSRKMIGYLVSLANGANTVLESDDDNELFESFFDPELPGIAQREILGSGFVNPYLCFTNERIWPRGFPLEQLRWTKPETREIASNEDVVDYNNVIVQGLANGNPDVDAVFRLTNPDFDFELFAFEEAGPHLIRANSGAWTPFNSQVTIWPAHLAMLMYLPVTCSFRMTDIWRGFIAQRILREYNGGILIPGALAYQERNEHNLLTDFSQEVEGYVGYEKFITVLNSLELSGGTMASRLRLAYEALTTAQFFTENERTYLEAWIADVEKI